MELGKADTYLGEGARGSYYLCVKFNNGNTVIDECGDGWSDGRGPVCNPVHVESVPLDVRRNLVSRFTKYVDFFYRDLEWTLFIVELREKYCKDLKEERRNRERSNEERLLRVEEQIRYLQQRMDTLSPIRALGE